MGGIRLDQITSPSMSSFSPLSSASFDAAFATIFEIPQKAAAKIVKKNAFTGIEVSPLLPRLAPISISPIPATTSPVIWLIYKDSFRNNAANKSVKKAADCKTTEEIPAGIPM